MQSFGRSEIPLKYRHFTFFVLKTQFWKWKSKIEEKIRKTICRGIKKPFRIPERFFVIFGLISEQQQYQQQQYQQQQNQQQQYQQLLQ